MKQNHSKLNNHYNDEIMQNCYDFARQFSGTLSIVGEWISELSLFFLIRFAESIKFSEALEILTKSYYITSFSENSI